MVFRQVDIYSLWNELEQLHEFSKDNLDMVLITKTKLHSYFPSASFRISGPCSP